VGVGLTPLNLNRFLKFFHWLIQHEFAVKRLLKIPLHLKRVATLLCEICVQEIAMLVNCVNKLPRKSKMRCKIHPLKIIVEKKLILV